MHNNELYLAIDLMVFLIANLINLLLVVIFLARTRYGSRHSDLERVVGLIIVTCAVPLSAAALLNISGDRSLWHRVLPLVTVSFLVIEYLLDYILETDFRSSRLLAPYLILFYLSEFAMIGYSFMLGKLYGFVTLATYFVHLGATFYSYARVRHGSTGVKSQPQTA